MKCSICGEEIETETIFPTKRDVQKHYARKHQDIYLLSSAISQSWKKKLMNEVDKTKPCFGFEIPLVGVHRIDKKKKNDQKLE